MGIFDRWREYSVSLVAREVSIFSNYYDRLIQVDRADDDRGELFDRVESPSKCFAATIEDVPDLSEEREQRTVLLFNGTLSHSLDIQGLLLRLKAKLSRTSRVVFVTYNPYLRWVYQSAKLIGLWRGVQPVTFVTGTDLQNIVKLATYEVVKISPVIYWPARCFGLGNTINSFLSVVPVFKWLSISAVIVLRPKIEEQRKVSLSVIIPARNESGNIRAALDRLAALSLSDLEVIFVEGHSRDDTWQEIDRLIPEYAGRFPIHAYQQINTGKSDAVRLGFSKASCDLVAILDADLTMPPELLPQFYEAYCMGLADFVNGNRLVYPSEDEAMRFLNRIGNMFFAKAISFVLGVRLGDTLCGTKLMARHDYERFVSWRTDFGDFDPFGDFELLFPAAELGLGVVDVPIRYRNRTYGTTNIRRFYHGWMLFKMTCIGLWRIKLRQRSRNWN